MEVNCSIWRCFRPLRKPHNSRCRNSAIDMREVLKEYLNGPGAVSWQLKYVRRTGDSDTDNA